MCIVGGLCYVKHVVEVNIMHNLANKKQKKVDMLIPSFLDIVRGKQTRRGRALNAAAYANDE